MCTKYIRKNIVDAGLIAAALVFLSAPASAAKNTLTVSARVLNKTGCSFVLPATAMNFGNIDPSLNSNATATANIVILCKGNPGTTGITIARDAGQNVLTNSLRMQNSSSPGNFLPYTLNLAGATWTVGLVIVGSITNNSNFSFALGGIVLPVDYKNAVLGPYTDNLVLTITP